MYAVIKTGGKQYRVQPGDLLVVEKLEADVGANVAFDQVLMLGGADGEVTVGAPIVDGAVVNATLIETRKGDKVKILKKIRRQGYRRTKGHRQLESVLRVIGLEGAGQSVKWDGEVDMTPRSTLRERARNLALRTTAPVAAEAAPVVEAAPAVEAEASAKKPARAKAPKAEAAVEATEVAAVEAAAVETAAVETGAEATPVEAAAEEKKPAKSRAKKAAATDGEA
jgi:large subunit ribosomal protein L21